MRVVRSAVAGAALTLTLAMVTAAQPPTAPALMQALNDELLAGRSATQTLEQWCGDHHLAAAPRIVARVVTNADKPTTTEQRQRLHVTGTDVVKFRHVRLQCGSRVLSEADNWYVPGRLSASMNHLLETTDTPFGTVVRPLEPYRVTLAVTMLWTTGAVPPEALFAHRALLFTRDRVPFSEVYEVYQRDILP
jgi:chorismate-pyruvate lyase